MSLKTKKRFRKTRSPAGHLFSIPVARFAACGSPLPRVWLCAAPFVFACLVAGALYLYARASSLPRGSLSLRPAVAFAWASFCRVRLRSGEPVLCLYCGVGLGFGLPWGRLRLRPGVEKASRARSHLGKDAGTSRKYRPFSQRRVNLPVQIQEL